MIYEGGHVEAPILQSDVYHSKSGGNCLKQSSCEW